MKTVTDKGGHSSYLDLLEFSFQMEQCFGSEGISREEFLAMEIFDFTTYDSEQDRMFVELALDVCEAISEGKTGRYLTDAQTQFRFLSIVNLPFFMTRIEWGTSIRHPWWLHENHSLKSTGLFSKEDEQIGGLQFTGDEWLEFLEALQTFYRK